MVASVKHELGESSYAMRAAFRAMRGLRYTMPRGPSRMNRTASSLGPIRALGLTVAPRANKRGSTVEQNPYRSPESKVDLDPPTNPPQPEVLTWRGWVRRTARRILLFALLLLVLGICVASFL